MIPILAVVGPTASGKTTLAIELAMRLNTEIISADAMQFYKGMEIGTAAPTREEQARVKHHFVSFLDPGEQMAAGEFERLARKVIADLNARGKIAIVAGGAGLYISALVDGLFQGPMRQPEIRERLKAEARVFGNAHLMTRLREADPDYAASLTSENDLVRIVRALEVYETTGQPFSRLHQEHRKQAEPMDALFVALDWDREDLYQRITHRVDQMAEQGWVDEVRALLEHGYGPHIDRLKALGYREIAACLRGEQTLDEALEATKMHHRRYAKRQLTWFRGDDRIHWFHATPNIPSSAYTDDILTLINKNQCKTTNKPRLLPRINS